MSHVGFDPKAPNTTNTTYKSMYDITKLSFSINNFFFIVTLPNSLCMSIIWLLTDSSGPWLASGPFKLCRPKA